MNSTRLSNWSKATFRGLGLLLAVVGLIGPTAVIAEVEATDADPAARLEVGRPGSADGRGADRGAPCLSHDLRR